MNRVEHKVNTIVRNLEIFVSMTSGQFTPGQVDLLRSLSENINTQLNEIEEGEKISKLEGRGPTVELAEKLDIHIPKINYLTMYPKDAQLNYPTLMESLKRLCGREMNCSVLKGEHTLLDVLPFDDNVHNGYFVSSKSSLSFTKKPFVFRIYRSWRDESLGLSLPINENHTLLIVFYENQVDYMVQTYVATEKETVMHKELCVFKKETFESYFRNKILDI